MSKSFIVLSVLVVLLLTGCNEQVQPNNNFKDAIVYEISYRNKTENCTYNLPYQDFECSPGHSFPLTALKINGVYAKEPGTAYVGDICEVGYSTNVRKSILNIKYIHIKQENMK
jgi:uncharacterized lipoprotein NlpE involved in copper resistance